MTGPDGPDRVPCHGKNAVRRQAMESKKMAGTILEKAVEGRVVWFSERPLPFEAFLELSNGTDRELVDGVMVERIEAQPLDHELLFGWLIWLLYGYVQQNGLGIVLGSRTAVEIGPFGGRLPDILFVRQERMEIVQQKGVYGPPDLVLEIASPNDKPSDIISLETDYRSVNVKEIWFIDPQRKRVRVLRRQAADYEEAELTTGTLASEAVAGFEIQVEWLFQDPRPNMLDTLTALLSPTAEE